MKFTRLLVILAGACSAIVVGRDGSPVWVIVRVLVVVALTHGTVVAVTRSGARRGGGAALGFGALVCGYGVGVAAPYLATEGWSVDGVVAAIAGLLGLVLVPLGAVRFVRSFGGWARLGAFAGVCAGLYLCLGLVSGVVGVFTVPRAELGRETPTDRRLSFESVRFRATDGVRLAGWFVPTQNGDVVVLLADASTTRSAVLDHAEVLARLGYGVLLFDPRGQGQSGGQAMALGWQAERDAAGAVEYLVARPDPPPGRVLVVGIETGGAAALGAVNIPGVCGAVADGITERVAADRGWLPHAHGVLGWFRLRGDSFRFALTSLLTGGSKPLSMRQGVATAAPRRALIIASMREPGAAEVAHYVEDASPRTVDVWVVPGAASGRVVDARQAEWIQRVGDFLADARC